MEGQHPDNEETPRPIFQPFQPQSFDEAEGAPARPSLLPIEGEFRQGHERPPGSESTFDERPHEAAETDFASLKFQRENTLLTNAESYAASIREEAQLYVRQLRSEVEALNQEAEERYAEAERIKAEAQAEAERLISDAQAQVDALTEEARGKGYEEGHSEGMKQRYDEAAPHLERLERILNEISQFRRRVAYYTEKDGIRLALLIAKKILHAEVKTNKQVVGKLLANSLSKLQGKGTFRVWLNPDDYQFITSARASLERFLDEDQSLTLRAKPDLSPGNVLIETDREVIDLTFDSQFHHLEQQLSQKLSERETTLLRRKAADSPPTQPAAAAQRRPQGQAPTQRGRTEGDPDGG